MSENTPNNSATLRMTINSPEIGKAALNIVNFMNDKPDSGLQRQLQGADTIAIVEQLALWLANDPVISMFLCRMVESRNTLQAVTDIAQELQAQVKHAETVVSRLRADLATQEQTIQRHEQAAQLWQVAADGMNEMLADTPEAGQPGPLVDRLRSLVEKYKAADRAGQPACILSIYA